MISTCFYKSIILLAWIGFNDSQILELLFDLNLWGLPLHNNIFWLAHDRVLTAWSVEDNATFDFRVGQPSLDDYRLWLDWNGRQALDHNLAWRRRQAFARDGDHLFADLFRRARWSLAHNQWFRGAWTGWLLTNDERRGWWGKSVAFLTDQDLAWRWRSWRTQVSDR